jgi:hypothetical protein
MKYFFSVSPFRFRQSTDIKQGPCGSDTNDFTGETTTLSPGPLTIEILESIRHDGAPFKVILSNEADDETGCVGDSNFSNSRGAEKHGFGLKQKSHAPWCPRLIIRSTFRPTHSAGREDLKVAQPPGPRTTSRFRSLTSSAINVSERLLEEPCRSRERWEAKLKDGARANTASPAKPNPG